MMPADLRGVLLDIDGTLVDSNDAHAQSWVEVLTRHNYRVTFEQIRPLIGMGGDKLLPTAVGVEQDSPEGKAISEARKQLFQQRYLPALRPFPQVRALLQTMRDRGLRLVVASSAEAEELKSLLAIAQATDLIESQTSAKDAEESKPEPDIVKVALDKLGLPPGRAIMLGDTPYDIEAARKLGVRTIALRCGGWTDPDLKDAVAIYQDPADLLTHYDQSPLAAKAPASTPS